MIPKLRLRWAFHTLLAEPSTVVKDEKKQLNTNQISSIGFINSMLESQSESNAAIFYSS